MPVSSIIVVLSPEPSARAIALGALASDARWTLGPIEGDALAAVLESPSTPACAELLRALEDTPGVLAVRPVFHDFSDEVPDHAAP
ncbi:MAG: hypothetical protein OHK0013_28680 [Sandaracinaceae bacterium]